jgi:ABC-type ATPase with predicted acetyltransferase domain
VDFDFTHRWQAGNSFREEAVKGTYDLKDVKLEKHIRGSIPVEGLEWQIGVVVGSSGSGKTSVARCLWPEAYYADLHDRYKASCFLNDFPSELSVKEISAALCSSGFSEPPSWLKSYAVLSQGQKMRVDIAHALCLHQNLVVFDEFTSTVDRTVAQIGSFAISRAVRKHPGKQFIAVTCHFDVLDWLEPDWVYDVGANVFYDYTGTLHEHITGLCTQVKVLKKKNDATQKSTYQCIGVALPCGRCLGNITI